MKNSFALADFVPYLLNRAGVRIGLAFARDIEPLGVTLPMWRVMAALWEKGDRRLGDIAARTSIDISTLSRLLGTLQRKKFIVRRRSGKDGRALSVNLTEKGRVMTERIIPIASHYEEVATRGITVNCVAPGMIRSAMTDALPEAQRQAILSRIPAGDLGTGEDIAAAIIYLASREASYITGQTLHVNGGMAMI